VNRVALRSLELQALATCLIGRWVVVTASGRNHKSLLSCRKTDPRFENLSFRGGSDGDANLSIYAYRYRRF
jgi:hypothetical protein